MVLQWALVLTLGSLLQLIFPFLVQVTMDIGIKNQSFEFIYLILLAQFILTVSESTIGFFRGWIMIQLSARINVALVTDFLQKWILLPMCCFDTKSTGDFLQTINEQDRIQSFLTNAFLPVLLSVFNMVIFGIVLLYYNMIVFLLFLVGSVLYCVWIHLFMKRKAAIDHENFVQKSANQNKIVQLIQGMPEVRLNVCEPRRLSEWEHIQAKLFHLRIRELTLAHYQDSGAMFINQIKNILITFLTAKLVLESQMTLGVMISVQYILGQLNASFSQLNLFIRQTQDAKLSLNRLLEIQAKKEEVPKTVDKTALIPQKQNISMKHISFAYNTSGDKINILHNINLSIESNKKTVLTGTVGSGKSTILKLLLGYYPVNDGNIYLGDAELSSFNLSEWLKKCGAIMQDGYIFSDTIARNIAPGEDEIDKKKLRKAVTIANLNEYIQSLPLSYDTIIGSEGSGLSQGRKQQILIARAVYKDPEFLFFDETAYSLDSINEMEIRKNFTSFFKNRTVLIVSSRLSVLRSADKIIVMERGTIAEVGKHEDLMLLKGTYYHLVKNQIELE